MNEYNTLRALIRTIIIENDDREVMGEPDLSQEDERDKPSDSQLEFSAISGGAGGISGAPMQPFVIDKKRTKKAKK